MAETEKRMAGNYEITQSIRIGDQEVVFGVDPNNAEPYFCALYHEQYELIQTRYVYENCVVGDDYLDAVETYTQYLQQQCQKVREDQTKVTVPRTPVTAEMCILDDLAQDLNGKVVALKPTSLYPEYRTADNQLVLVAGGFGASAKSRGTTCFCINLYTGRSENWRRYDILGEVKPECLPDWAKERAAAIQARRAEKKQARKTSVLDR